MTISHGGVLASGHDVPFADIELALARYSTDSRRRRRGPARALTATVIVIGPPDRVTPAAEALDQLSHAGGIRTILISEGDQVAPNARVADSTVSIAGLSPRYLNNAVAALRLSSLPAVVWWRGGFTDNLDELADLSDRLILDTDPPDEAWAHAPKMIEHTALTDLRWTRLTRWRSALAHLFDLPQVRRRAPSITSLEIAASDLPSARLFAGWLRSSLRWAPTVTIAIEKTAAGRYPLERVTLTGDAVSVALKIRDSGACLEAAVDGVDASARVVPLGDGALSTLIAEELAVRTRDVAFERALAAARGITA